MREMRRRRQQWRIFTLTVICVACALVAVHYGIEAAARIGARRQPVSLRGPQTIEAGTKLIWVTTYTICGDEERREAPPERAAIGLSADKLQAASPGWVVESFAHDQVILRHTAMLCEFHRSNRTLKISDGSIVIYYGTPDRLGPKMEAVADISPESLVSDDRKQLEKGLLFRNDDPSALDDMISSYLEGITE